MKNKRKIKDIYKQAKYSQGFNFYGEGLFDQPILLKRWVLNWKFPFIHRIVKRYTVASLQKELNKLEEKRIVEIFKNAFKRE